MRDRKTYIGVKMIEAQPMTRGEYNKYREWDIPANEDPSDEGYLIISLDGLEQWLPKAEFEKYHFQLTQDNSVPGDSISIEDIHAFSGKSMVTKITEKTALVTTRLRNGFELFHASSCVDPNNFKSETAAEIGCAHNMSKARELLGFVLQWARFGLEPAEKKAGEESELRIVRHDEVESGT